MKLTRLVPVAAALSLLAACSPAPSTVALVGDTRITTEDLQRSVDGCAELGLTTEMFPEKQHVVFLAAGELVRQAAEAHGITISDGEWRALAGQGQFAGALGNEDCSGLAYPGAAMTLLTPQVGEEQIVSELRSIDVQVNPRYGHWDAESLGLIGNGSLSLPSVP